MSNGYLCVYNIYIYISLPQCVYVYIQMYIYIYIQRERERYIYIYAYNMIEHHFHWRNSQSCFTPDVAVAESPKVSGMVS